MPPPRFITCQLCSQQFGSTSIGIHVPQCHEKMYKRWQNMDPKTRGNPPPMPVMISGGGVGGMGGGGSMRSSSMGVGGSRLGASGRGGGGYGASGSGSAYGAGGGGMGGSGYGDAPIRKPVPKSQQGPFIPQQQYQYGVEYAPIQTNKCRRCGRGFSYDRLAYHESVCKGEGGTKRRAFNSKKQRLGDFDQFELGAGGKGGTARGGGKGMAASRAAAPAPNRTNWRQQHNEFINAIREAKRYAPPPKSYQPTAPRGPTGPREPFQGSAQRNMVTQRHQHQQQNISYHASIGNGRTRSSGPSGYRGGAGGGGGTLGSGLGGGGGGGRAFGSNTDRWSGGGSGYGGGGGMGGGANKYSISHSNETSLGMRQAFGMR